MDVKGAQILWVYRSRSRGSPIRTRNVFKITAPHHVTEISPYSAETGEEKSISEMPNQISWIDKNLQANVTAK